MMKILLLALILFILYVGLDFLWFEAMGNFFKGEIGGIARLDALGNWDVRIGVSLLVYVLMTLGMGFFVLHHSESFGQIALYGAFFGLVVYGVYDATNLATLSAWTYRFALADIVWGIILNTAVAVSGKALADWLA